MPFSYVVHQEQKTGSGIQEKRVDFENKLQALGFEVVGDSAVASVSNTCNNVQTVRAELVSSVNRTSNSRLPPSGASRVDITPVVAKVESSASEDETEEEDEENLDDLIMRARNQVDEVIRREMEDEDDSYAVQESEEYTATEYEEEEIQQSLPPPPPPRGRSIGYDAVSTNSTSAWNSTEDINAAVERIRSVAESNTVDESDEETGDAIDSLSFEGSSEETEDTLEDVKPKETKIASRKSTQVDSVMGEKERELKRQLIVQDGVIQQTMKALLECQSRRAETSKKKGMHVLGSLFGSHSKVEPSKKDIGSCRVGSLAEADFYRVLLIAIERRKAIHAELRRLNSRRSIAPSSGIPPVTVTISDIQLQLKHEFRMRQINSGTFFFFNMELH